MSDLRSSQQTNIGCHLANIALRVGRVVTWDAAANTIAGDAEAAAMLSKTYRAPWDRELRASINAV
jgi:hypothetical protein